MPGGGLQDGTFVGFSVRVSGFSLHDPLLTPET
jgi:hypothetical protein